MENEEFVRRLREKIERLAECTIDLNIDIEEPDRLRVDHQQDVPQVVLGSNIYEYSGFARMCAEYAVASIRERRPIELLEFHSLLARN